ncbi:MAG: glucose-6-phosphate dehydrogenase [Calditrichia bacterium]
MDRPEDCILVIFGASGDLTRRKLVPAIFSLFTQGLLPEKFVLLGASRTNYSDEDFRRLMEKAIRDAIGTEGSADNIKAFIKQLYYTSIDFHTLLSYAKLKERIQQLADKGGKSGNVIYYLSTPPSLYGVIPRNLAEMGMHRQQDGWKRVIVEKPFGYDYQSALELKDILLRDWQESQIYRIDHYLGKETVQNLLVTRFSNGIFEPLWNRNYIHHIEITAAESIGVEKRGGYYDSSGALRDMVQNHLLQVFALTAMEPPASLEADAIRNEILKVLQSLRPIRKDEVPAVALRGQYTASHINGKAVKGYREEEGVAPDSMTETYVALKFYVDNWRWGGVPFYIRTGKRLPTRVSEVVIHFKATPHRLFTRGDVCQACNQLVIRIQPDEGILLKFSMKIPGAGLEVQNVNMDFHYSDLADQRIPEAYERLLYDTMKGDSTLFARTEEVLLAWKFLMPIIESWQEDKSVPLYGYPAGTWGPENADDLIEEAGMTWRYPCKNLANDGVFCEL